MIQVRRATERGHADHGWLKTYHTFSFADYQDRNHMRFRALRVMNEDFVAPGRGFGTHPHQDMEIVTYVLSGALQHQDSMGNGTILRAGEFQRMTAGTGITHSEYNPSSSEPVHLYQIWLFPERKGLEPSYEQKIFPKEDRANRWQLVASNQPLDGALAIHQDAQVFLADLALGQSLAIDLKPGRHAWIQVLKGSLKIGDQEIATSDGVAISEVERLSLTATSNAELMMFDLA